MPQSMSKDRHQVSGKSREAMPDTRQGPEICDDAGWTPTKHEAWTMVSVATVSLMVSLDATVFVTSLPSLVSDLKCSTTDAFWIATSYLLTCAVVMPLTASLCMVMGRLTGLLIALIVFTIGTALCSISHRIDTMIAGRCVQGVGGGGIIILGLVVFTDIVPLRLRSKYYGMVQAAWALGTCIGPIIGALMVRYATWRWVFYIMFPMCGLGTAMFTWMVISQPARRPTTTDFSRVNWFAEILFLISSASLLVAISRGGTQEAWRSIRTMAPLSIGAVGMLFSGIWKEGLFDWFHERSRSCRISNFAAYLSSAIQGFLLYGVLYYIPLYWFKVRGDSPIRVAVNLLPLSVFLAPTSVVVGICIANSGHFRWALRTGWALVFVAQGLLILWGFHTSIAQCAITIIILGIGHGLVLSSLNFGTQATAQLGQEHQAAAKYMFYRSFGMALGVGIGASAFQNIMVIRLKYFGISTKLALDLEATKSVTWSSLQGEQPRQVLESSLYGIHGIYGLFCGAAGLAFLACFVVGPGNKEQEHETHVEVKDETAV